MSKNLESEFTFGKGVASADRVKFVEPVYTRSASHTVPVITATFAPAVDPGLANRRKIERAKFAGFAGDPILVAT